MLILVLSILSCALAYAIKGGSGASLFKNWNYVRGKNKFYDRILDGKVLSTVAVFVASFAITGGDIEAAALVALGWLIAVAPSMGEEQGAVGDWKEAWGPYIDKGFGRNYGVKKAIQRGIMMGGVMTMLTGFVPFLWASLLYVPVVFLGQSLSRLVLKQRGWVLAEPIIGAIVFGLPVGLYLIGRFN